MLITSKSVFDTDSHHKSDSSAQKDSDRSGEVWVVVVISIEPALFLDAIKTF